MERNSTMYQIQYIGDDGKNYWLKVDGERPQFRNRKKVRNYCRNHYYAFPHKGLIIVHPDGTKEEFTYDGPVLARQLGK